MKPTPFFEKAIAAAVYKVDMPSLEVFKAVLLSLARLTETMAINFNHDAIEEAFKVGMNTLSASGVRNITSDLEPLFRHIAAEKERVVVEARALEERARIDNRISGSGDWGMAEEALPRTAN